MSIKTNIGLIFFNNEKKTNITGRHSNLNYESFMIMRHSSNLKYKITTR